MHVENKCLIIITKDLMKFYSVTLFRLLIRSDLNQNIFFENNTNNIFSTLTRLNVYQGSPPKACVDILHFHYLHLKVMIWTIPVILVKGVKLDKKIIPKIYMKFLVFLHTSHQNAINFQNEISMYKLY